MIREARLKVVIDPLYGSAQGYLDTLLRGRRLRRAAFSTTGGTRILAVARRNPRRAICRSWPSRWWRLRPIWASPPTGMRTASAWWMPMARSWTPNYFLGLLLRHLVTTRGWTGGVGALGRRRAICWTPWRAGWGSRSTRRRSASGSIGELIAKDGLVLGGEESAGLSVKGHVPEKDGILACLLAAELVASRGRARLRTLLQELYAEVGTFLTTRVTFRLEPRVMEDLRERLRQPPGERGGPGRHRGESPGWREDDPGGRELAAVPALRDGAGGSAVRRGVDPEQVDRLVTAGEALIGDDGSVRWVCGARRGPAPMCRLREPGGSRRPQ